MSSSLAKANRRSKNCCRSCDVAGQSQAPLRGVAGDRSDSRHRLQRAGTIGARRHARCCPISTRSPSRIAPPIDLPTLSRMPGAARHGFAPVSLITARGCPYTCTWCSRSVFGTTHRRRSPVNVADEVEPIVDRYRPDRLWYADDVFAIHRGWTLEYAAELRAAAPAPAVRVHLARRAHRRRGRRCAGRAWVLARVDRIGKRLAAHPRRDAAPRDGRPGRERRRGCGAAGIQVGMFIMLGYDGERRRTCARRSSISKRTAPDIFLTTVSYPIKGTPYYDACRGSAVGAHSRGPSAPIATWSIARPAAAPLLRLRPAVDRRRSRARPALARRPLRAGAVRRRLVRVRRDASA